MESPSNFKESPDDYLAPIVYTVVRENWLTKKPSPMAFFVVAIASLLLSLGALIAWHDLFSLLNKMDLSRNAFLVSHDIWRLWTALTVHADSRHLFGNLFLFSVLGYFLNGYFGTLVFPVLAFLMGGLVNALVILGMAPEARLMGASGMVFWMGGFWLVMYWFLDRRKSLLQRSLRTAGVALALFMPSEAFDPHISYQSHFIGFVIGVSCALIYYFANKKQFEFAEIKEVIYEY